MKSAEVVDRRNAAPIGDSAADLLEAAATGSQSAWETIVDRYREPVWRVIRGFRLDHATSEDVAQFVWMQLLQNLDKIRDPERLAAWLGVTARRAAIDVYRSRGRVIATEDIEATAELVSWDSDHVVAAEERAAVVRALATLPGDMQELLSLVAIDPPLPYVEIAAMLDRPVGSIGPSRARALRRLRTAYEAALGIKVG